MILAGLCITAAAALSVQRTTVSPATVLIAPVPTQGIDVSSLQHPHNAVIRWPDVAAAGNTFAAIKASEGTYYVNPYYASDAVQAAGAGLFVMPYAFANPFPAKTNGSAKAQADAAARQLRSASVPASRMLPLALDIEPDPYAARQHTNQCYGLRPAAMVSWIRQFLTEAQLKTGTTPVIYTTTAWWKTCTGNSAAFGSYPLWIASYGPSAPVLPGGWRKYTFWQHTATGAIRGVSGSSTDEDFLGPVSRTRPEVSHVSVAQFPPPASVGITDWITAALLVVSVGIAALVGFAIGFSGDGLSQARTGGTGANPATRVVAQASLAASTAGSPARKKSSTPVKRGS